jgi:hypothetical protein
VPDLPYSRGASFFSLAEIARPRALNSFSRDDIFADRFASQVSAFQIGHAARILEYGIALIPSSKGGGIT